MNSTMKYRESDFKYQLAQTFGCKTLITGLDVSIPLARLFPNGDLRMKQGFAFDGPTGLPDMPELMGPSAAHDALYRMIRMGVLTKKHKKKADETLVMLYRKIAEKEDCPSVLRDVVSGLVEKGVEVFGDQCLDSEKEKVKEAPAPE